MIKKCRICNNDFVCKYPKQIYCSPKCSHESKRNSIIVFCEICSKPKIINNTEYKSNKNGKFFCNKECFDKFQRGGIDNFIVKCSCCEKEKIVTPFEYNKYKNHFCNKECQNKWQISSGHTRGENSARYKSLIKKCSYVKCGRKIKVSPWQENSSINQFCSYSCRSAWYSENLSGKNSPLWSGGYNENDYGPEFNKKLKRLVYKRDEYKCQLCGKRRVKQRICAHHIDYDKKNNSFVETIDDKESLLKNNLISLCDSCHTKTNHNRDFWQRWFKSSSSFWFAARSYNTTKRHKKYNYKYMEV